MATWTDPFACAHFRESFGIGRGRLVARYPKRWQRLVWQASRGNTELARKRLEELLAGLSDCMVKRSCSHFDSKAGDWFENAMREHERRPFQAILAQSNLEGHPEVLIGEDVISEASHPLWAVSRTRTVAREAQAMADAVAPVLRNGSTILFVDPYFNPSRCRYQRTLAAFLRTATTARPGPAPERIEILLAAHERTGTDDFFRQKCIKRLKGCAPNGLRIVVRRLAEKADGEKLHNRYILTNLGGIHFGIGLDDGKEGQTDDLSLLDRDAYERRWSQYSGEPPAAFHQEGDSVTVNGTA